MLVRHVFFTFHQWDETEYVSFMLFMMRWQCLHGGAFTFSSRHWSCDPGNWIYIFPYLPWPVCTKHSKNTCWVKKRRTRCVRLKRSAHTIQFCRYMLEANWKISTSTTKSAKTRALNGPLSRNYELSSLKSGVLLTHDLCCLLALMFFFQPNATKGTKSSL